jgi:hypothetical protein
VKHRWKPEVDHYAPDVPFLLVGTLLIWPLFQSCGQSA